LGSVDYDLNKAIHSFSITHGGKTKGGAKRKLVIREEAPNITSNGEIKANDMALVTQRLKHEDMKRYIKQDFSQYTWKDVKMENLCEDKSKGGASGQIIKYTPSQDFVRNYFTPANPVKGFMLWHSVGTGKCHAINTPIIMFDGSIKMVQDIKVGDLLMGDDSKPRTVLSLAQGKDELYDVTPIKGDKYTVNSEHILCLKPTHLNIEFVKKQKNFPYVARYMNKTGKVTSKGFKTKEEADIFLNEIHNSDNIVEIPIKDYINLSNTSKRNLKGYRVGLHFPSKKVDFDPYIIGFWLGDGSKRDPVISFHIIFPPQH